MSLKYEVQCDLRGNRYVKYYRHGVKHRKDGPASLWDDGDLFWFLYGEEHRLDGPAEIYNGIPCYYIHGYIYTKEQYESKIHNY